MSGIGYLGRCLSRSSSVSLIEILVSAAVTGSEPYIHCLATSYINYTMFSNVRHNMVKYNLSGP